VSPGKQALNPQMIPVSAQHPVSDTPSALDVKTWPVYTSS
jgi:hypothetical protein